MSFNEEISLTGNTTDTKQREKQNEHLVIKQRVGLTKRNEFHTTLNDSFKQFSAAKIKYM